MTLLASVNRVRRALREDTISEISANDQLTQSIIDLLNTSADELLNARDWAFLIRHDAQVWFPALHEETTGATTINNSATVLLNTGGANAWAAPNVLAFTDSGQTGRLLCRLEMTGGAMTPNTAYPVDILASTVNFPVTLRTIFRGDSLSTTAGFRIYSHEAALPATQRRVLSVRHQETPLRLEFVDRYDSFDRAVPRVADQTSDRPEVAYVGGLVTGSAQTTAAQVSGLGFMIWPVPLSAVTIDYTYVYRFADLSADADEWTGVPSEHIRLVESMAFEKALDNNIEDDPERAARIRVKNENVRFRLVNADERAPVRRVTPEIGKGRAGAGTNSRWNSQVVPSP